MLKPASIKRRLIIVLSIFLVSLTSSMCFGAIYYVDATNGNDANTGLSEATSWKTITKVNSSSFQPGDNILFKKDEVWREELRLASSGVSGNLISLGAYGTGNKPRITGADIIKSFTKLNGFVHSAYVHTEPHVVIYNAKKLNRNVLSNINLGKNEWNWQSNTLYVNVEEDPNKGVLEASQRDQCIVIFNVNYVKIQDMIFESSNFQNYGNIYIDGISSNITVSNCSSRYSSGSGIFFGQNPKGNNIITDCKFYENERYGINSWKHNSGFASETIFKRNEIFLNQGFGVRIHANYWIVEESNIHDNGNKEERFTGIWIGTIDRSDSFGEHNIIRRNSVYNQIGKMPDGSGITVDWDSNANQIYYNKVFYNDGPGIDINDSTNHQVYNNICYANCQFRSGGVGAKSEIRVVGINGSDLTSNVQIKNNIAYATKADYAIYVDSLTSNNQIFFSNNNWYKPFNDFWYWGFSHGSDLTDWNSKPGVSNDINSNPMFIDPLSFDFKLQSDSPCIDSGVFVGLTQDFDQTIVPIGIEVDVGSLEYKRLVPPIKLRILNSP